MGNPLSYRGATLTWNGRLLMSYEKDGTKYAYTYNADNLRTSKSKYVNNTLVSKETYIWSGDVLIATKKYDCATATSDVIRYLYDSNGESHGFTYNGNTYLYVKNLQGDVIAIISAGDELLCLGLNYDPWGKVTYMTDEEADEYELQVAHEIAAINNIAYRGYFYDSETGLYYLQSRYYDPEVGRFINADDTKYISCDDDSVSCNLFAYCFNSPIMHSDADGYWGKNDHVALCNSYGRSTFLNNVAFFDKECDASFASTDQISYPFHNRNNTMLKNSVKMLYNYAISIYKQKKRRVFTYSQLFSNNGFTCLHQKSEYKSWVRGKNNRILDYINSKNIDYKAQAAMLLGFCLHMVQDYYAHRIIVRCESMSNKWKTIVDLDIEFSDSNKYKKFVRCSLEDNKDIFPWRYSKSKDLTKKILDMFFSGKKINNLVFYEYKNNKDKDFLEIKTGWFSSIEIEIQSYHQTLWVN